jgi:hypothetical protein
VRFVLFFAGFNQDSPGFLGDPQGCPRQMGRRTYYFLLKSHANLVINTSCILLYLSNALYIECNHRLQELLLGELIQGSILWLVTKKLVIPCFA